MELFHFSEDSTIIHFEPRVKSNRTDMPPVVWAIDQEHEFTFYVPRDCPRIVYRRSEGLSEADHARFFGASPAEIIMTVEAHWYQAIRDATIYRYTLPGDSFAIFDETAGYYISEKAVDPIRMDPLTNLIERIIALDVEIRFTPSLHPLREAILNSSLADFGIHRFENAGKF
ncbi:hypothetical protein LOZ80_27810 [Paenibacillus sp. HWE-109]|uniref:DUF6886 family protein n=1 Tax=Paenibacillus sp. HWE-109 TaxID=1306526 RepID=UPI001EDFB1F4|nr:DUF6886 family protein [Paenibacillus sp. HWE-109]UKS25373.1 hypothetical protein LOZ80_27810 [Paenibacillus sp. HWE-109]